MREAIDWMALYAYPSHLVKLKPGDVGIFVCPAAWRGRLGTVCGIWIKGNTDWASRFPPGTSWSQVFSTEAHVDGLKVMRAPLAKRLARSSSERFRCLPRGEFPCGGAEDLQRTLAFWSPAFGRAGIDKRVQHLPTA